MPEKIYVNVLSDFDSTGYMRPQAIIWKDGRVFRIESIQDYRPACIYRPGMRGDVYTVIIRGEPKHLFFEKLPDQFATRIGRWYVEKKTAG